MNSKAAKWDSPGSPEKERLKKLLGAAGVLGVLVAVIWWPGCRQYPPVTSRENLVLIKLVYTACNTRSAKRLDAARERIDKAASDGRLSPAEEAGFRKIIDTAATGNWQAAEAAAFRFANDQIGQGP